MQHLEEQYLFSKIDYKLFHPNLIRNYDHIEFHQISHRAFTIDPPILVTKIKKHVKSHKKNEQKTGKI